MSQSFAWLLVHWGLLAVSALVASFIFRLLAKNRHTPCQESPAPQSAPSSEFSRRRDRRIVRLKVETHPQ